MANYDNGWGIPGFHPQEREDDHYWRKMEIRMRTNMLESSAVDFAVWFGSLRTSDQTLIGKIYDTECIICIYVNIRHYASQLSEGYRLDNGEGTEFAQVRMHLTTKLTDEVREMGESLGEDVVVMMEWLTQGQEAGEEDMCECHPAMEEEEQEHWRITVSSFRTRQAILNCRDYINWGVRLTEMERKKVLAGFHTNNMATLSMAVGSYTTSYSEQLKDPGVFFGSPLRQGRFRLMALLVEHVHDGAGAVSRALREAIDLELCGSYDFRIDCGCPTPFRGHCKFGREMLRRSRGEGFGVAAMICEAQARDVEGIREDAGVLWDVEPLALGGPEDQNEPPE